MLRDEVLQLWNSSHRVGEVGRTRTHTFKSVYPSRYFRHTWSKDHAAVVFHHIASSHNITKLGNVRLHYENNSISSPAWGSYVCSRSKIWLGVNHDITLWNMMQCCPSLQPLNSIWGSQGKHDFQDKTHSEYISWLNGIFRQKHQSYLIGWLCYVLPQKAKD